MASTLLAERERGTKTCQIVKGIGMGAYWSGFLFIDLIRCYTVLYMA